MMSQHTLLALIARWRQAANEATTSDAVSTYLECADALNAAIAVRILVAVCEGCGIEIPMPTQNRRKVYPDLPVGWTQTGVSKHRSPGRAAGSRLAAWCQICQKRRRDAQEVA